MMRHAEREHVPMKVAILAIPLLVLAGSAQARDIKPDIDAANAKFVAAFNKGDAAGIGQLYTEHATALPPGAPMAKGRAAIQAFWQGAIQSGLKNASLKALQVDQFGNAAREIGTFSLDAPDAQKQMVHVEGKYVVLWRRERSGWKLDTDIWNMNQ
jgi:ketosteroid isomerase-like protein